MSVVVHWQEHSAYGFSLEFLCCVADMGEARKLAQLAEAMNSPAKEGRLRRNHPLVAVAEANPGELLWRPIPENSLNPSKDPHDPPWAVGTESAREIRQADVDRYNSVYEAAQARRRERRHRG